MKRLSLIIAFLVFASLSIVFASVALGETYYVRKGGNNNNTGTGTSKNQAWKTMSYAVSKLKAGDACYVMDDDGGDYGEKIDTYGAKSGDSNHKITLAVQPGDTVYAKELSVWKTSYWVIDGFAFNGGSGGWAIFIYGGDHNTIQNINVTGRGWGHIGKIMAKLDEENPATYNTLKNIDASGATITGTPREAFYIGMGPDDCAGTSWAKTGSPDANNTFINIKISDCSEGFDIKPGSKNTLIQGCYISGCSQCGVIAVEETTVEKCLIDGSSVPTNKYWAGVYVAKNCTVRNNIIYGYHGNNCGIATVNQYNTPVSGNKIYNNTIYDCGRGILVEDAPSTVKNNIIYNCSSYELYVDYGAQTSMVDYNNYYDDIGGNLIYWKGNKYNASQVNNGTYSSKTGQGTDDKAYNPFFINATSYDFHLREGSPCIDAGINVGLAYYGSAPDMGALEYYGGPIAPPTGLKVITTK